MISLSNFVSMAYGQASNEKMKQYERINNLQFLYSRLFDKLSPPRFFSAPGRIEIIGNHTDHNLGTVLAAGISRDILGAVSPSKENLVAIYDLTLQKWLKINISHLESQEKEKGTSEGLIRGILSGFRARDYNIGGFSGCIASNVKQGSGLSSSAAFEVIIGYIINNLYNNSKLSSLELAVIGQEAENKYLGKPCGLMDQLASAFGCCIQIDFKNRMNPEIKPVSFDPENNNYSVVVVETGGDHSSLTPYYSAIAGEMHGIASFFNKETLSEISWNDLVKDIQELRKRAGDRAVLRALHFFQENSRVNEAEKALLRNDFPAFLKQLENSGHSSLQFLQNGWVPEKPEQQGLPLALSLSFDFFKEMNRKGVSRIQGGGFAGTILTILPSEYFEGYKKILEPVFGPGSLYELFIRRIPVCEFTNR